MSDKRKAGGSACDQRPETERQFLERTNVASQIRDVLAKVIENRPEDPIGFLADYFESVGDKGNKVTRAHQTLLLTHYTQPAFQNNIQSAYEILGQCKVHRHLRGINGVVFGELLDLILHQVPTEISDKLLKKIACRDYEVVVYDVFRAGVITAFVFHDYIKQSEALYNALDTSSYSNQVPPGASQMGRANKTLCDAALQQLLLAVTTTGDDATSVIEAGYSLCPDQLTSTFSQALIESGDNHHGDNHLTMKRDEFIQQSAETFLHKVKPLK